MKIARRMLFLSGLLASSLLMSEEVRFDSNYEVFCESKVDHNVSNFAFIAPADLGPFKKTISKDSFVIENVSELEGRYRRSTGFAFFKKANEDLETNSDKWEDKALNFIYSQMTPSSGCAFYDLEFQIKNSTDEEKYGMGTERMIGSGRIFVPELGQGYFQLFAKQIVTTPSKNGWWSSTSPKSDTYYLIAYSFEKEPEEIKKDLHQLASCALLISNTGICTYLFQ